MIESEEASIQFFSEDIDFILEDTLSISDWLKTVIETESWQLTLINFVFCSDAYLHNMNVKYLQHDTLTDVITFYYSTEKVEGDIFISIDRIKENAEGLNIPFSVELQRVMVHGTLHLLGYGDKTPDDKILMTEKENFYLNVLAPKISI